MIITCIGHAMFLIEAANGTRIVTDPTDAYPVETVTADAVLVSHAHHDHCCLDVVSSAAVITEAGRHTIGSGITVTGIPSWHDDQKGTKRGSNIINVIEADGLRVAHLGDLGAIDDALDQVGTADIVMVPVGGFYTIDAEKAVETCRRLKAKVIIPMHYRTSYIGGWPIAPVDDFLSHFSQAEISHQPLLRVTAGDISCVPPVIVLQPMLKG